MISREEAERVAARWARDESVRCRATCVPVVDEIAAGWVVRIKKFPEALPQPGEGVAVIDKETGAVSHWPALSLAYVEQQHLQHRSIVLRTARTADPSVELRRSMRLRPGPTVIAELTLNGRRYLARGAKGDQELQHHPLVRGYLDTVPPGHLVRGGERHAELIVLSDALHAMDRERADRGEPPVSEQEARQLLGTALLEVMHVREYGDPLDGQPARPCESCVNALIYFGLLPSSFEAYVQEWRPPLPAEVPQPGRFPDEVAAALVEGNWGQIHTDDFFVDHLIEETVAVAGATHRHEPFPAARQALLAFGFVFSGRCGPGRENWIRRLEINPESAAHSADILGEFGALLGTRLFPIGSEGMGETIVAVDEAGRIFALDQAGEWFLGDTIDTALINIITGGPIARVRDDGTW